MSNSNRDRSHASSHAHRRHAQGPYAPPGPHATPHGDHGPRRGPARPSPRAARVAARARHELAQADRHGLLPIAGGLAIDVVDFATMGPIGVFAGAIVGGFVTWTVASRHGLSSRMVAMMTFLGALYCTIPFTELLPLATLLAIVSRLLPAAAEASAEAKTRPSFGPASFGEPAYAAEPVRVRQTGAPRR